MSRPVSAYDDGFKFTKLSFGEVLDAKPYILESSTNEVSYAKVLAFNSPLTANIYTLNYSLTTAYQVICLSSHHEHHSSHPK